MSLLGAALRRFLKFLALLRPATTPVDSIVVGIGNPGDEYAVTRHNVGWMAVDSITEQLKGIERERACHAELAMGSLPGGTRIACAKPTTFVNRSGRAVKALIDRFSLDGSRCLVVVDDFNLPLGRLRFRRQGSDGGHNGLRSVIAAIGNKFPRLRVGIGPVPEGVSAIDFVLGRFAPQEEENKQEAIRTAAQAAALFCERGIDAAMSAYNN